MFDEINEPYKGNILVVDDTMANLRLLSKMLTQQNYKVRPVTTGTMALTVARSTPLDLILLDINMTDMSGYEVCRQLKKDETTQNIPIIFISALGETTDKLKAFEVGGVDYITKPFQFAEVMARVETHLKIQELQRDLHEQIAELNAFAYTVAHDLKNPLSSLVGYAQLLRYQHEELEVEEINDMLSTIQKSSYKATMIIDELLLIRLIMAKNKHFFVVGSKMGIKALLKTDYCYNFTCLSGRIIYGLQTLSQVVINALLMNNAQCLWKQFIASYWCK